MVVHLERKVFFMFLLLVISGVTGKMFRLQGYHQF